MKEYRVRYYLSDMYHTYIITAENEYKAIKKALSIPEECKELLHDFKIDRYYQPWN